MVVAAAQAEADDGEGNRRDALEALVGIHPSGEFAGELHVAAEELHHALTSEVAQDEPELESAEAMAEGHAIVHQMHGARVFAGAQVFGHQRESLAQNLRLAGVEGAEVHRGHQPFVRIGDDGVGALDAREMFGALGQQGAGSGIGAIDVQPEAELFGQRGALGDRVHRGR